MKFTSEEREVLGDHFFEMIEANGRRTYPNKQTAEQLTKYLMKLDELHPEADGELTRFYKRPWLKTTEKLYNHLTSKILPEYDKRISTVEAVYREAYESRRDEVKQFVSILEGLIKKLR